MSEKYILGRDAFGSGNLSWTGDDIRAQLVSSQYEFSEDDSKIAGAVGDAVRVPGRSIRDGWARAGTVNFRQVKGAAVTGIVFFRVDGLLVYFADHVQGFPMIPNGGDIEVEVMEPGIFRI